MEALVARPGGPEGLLVLAPDHAHHVEPPRLLRCLRIPQRTEGDLELGRPAVVEPLRRHPPDPSPVGVEGRPFVRDQRVELGPVGIRGEDHRVAAVAEGVEQDGDAVVPRELVAAVEAAGLHQLVALPDPCDHPGRLAVAGQHADVEVVRVVEDPHFGRLGGESAFLRLALPQLPRGIRARPGGLVEAAVDPQLLGAGRQPHRLHGRLLPGGGHRRLHEREHEHRQHARSGE
jgi:hypothetical protein